MCGHVVEIWRGVGRNSYLFWAVLPRPRLFPIVGRKVISRADGIRRWMLLVLFWVHVVVRSWSWYTNAVINLVLVSPRDAVRWGPLLVAHDRRNGVNVWSCNGSSQNSTWIENLERLLGSVMGLGESWKVWKGGIFVLPKDNHTKPCGVSRSPFNNSFILVGVLKFHK